MINTIVKCAVRKTVPVVTNSIAKTLGKAFISGFAKGVAKNIIVIEHLPNGIDNYWWDGVDDGILLEMRKK